MAVFGIFCNLDTLADLLKESVSRAKCSKKILINTKNYSNLQIFWTLEISESSGRWIKKKINLCQQWCPQRTYKCGRKPIFRPRSERCLEKNCLENHFATTKQIKLNLKSRGILASETTVRRKFSKMNFKTQRRARKPNIYRFPEVQVSILVILCPCQTFCNHN